MARTATVVMSLAFAPVAEAFGSFSHGHGFLAGSMQPDVAARTLASVEDEWAAQTTMFAECTNQTAELSADPLVDCNRAPKAFGKSCTKVVQAMVRGSGGDKESVQEYLSDVCGQMLLQGRRAERCHTLADGISNAMTQDAFENREFFKTDSLCSSLWSQFLEEEKLSLSREQAVREEEERKAKEAEEAEQKAKAEREAAEEAQRKKDSEEAARRAAEESKSKAEKSAKDKAEAAAKAKVEAAAKAKAEAAEKAKADAAAKAKKQSATKTKAAAAATVKDEKNGTVDTKTVRKVVAKTDRKAKAESQARTVKAAKTESPTKAESGHQVNEVAGFVKAKAKFGNATKTDGKEAKAGELAKAANGTGHAFKFVMHKKA